MGGKTRGCVGSEEEDATSGRLSEDQGRFVCSWYDLERGGGANGDGEDGGNAYCPQLIEVDGYAKSSTDEGRRLCVVCCAQMELRICSFAMVMLGGGKGGRVEEAAGIEVLSIRGCLRDEVKRSWTHYRVIRLSIEVSSDCIEQATRLNDHFPTPRGRQGPSVAGVTESIHFLYSKSTAKYSASVPIAVT